MSLDGIAWLAKTDQEYRQDSHNKAIKKNNDNHTANAETVVKITI